MGQVVGHGEPGLEVQVVEECQLGGIPGYGELLDQYQSGVFLEETLHLSIVSVQLHVALFSGQLYHLHLNTVLPHVITLCAIVPLVTIHLDLQSRLLPSLVILGG